MVLLGLGVGVAELRVGGTAGGWLDELSASRDTMQCERWGKFGRGGSLSYLPPSLPMVEYFLGCGALVLMRRISTPRLRCT